MANQKRIDNFLEEIRTAFIKTIELLGNVKDDSFHSVIKASHDKIADKYRDIVYRSRVVWEDYDGLVYIHYETVGVANYLREHKFTYLDKTKNIQSRLHEDDEVGKAE